MNTWPLQKNCDAYYGNPRGKNGQPSAAWEAANLVYVSAPWRLTYDGRPTRLRVHKKVADSLKRVLAEIWEWAGRKQSVIDECGMSVTGGGYNFRLKRGGSSLSMHSWGCALDFDPANNGMGDTTPKLARYPAVLAAFAREGWEWGGDWSGKSCDGMHWQAAWTRANAVRPPSAKAKAAPSPAKAADRKLEPAITDKATVEFVQRRLRELNYAEVGNPDGRIGDLTRGAIRIFRADNGLPEGADIDAAVLVALAVAKPRELSAARANATAAEVREAVPEARASFVNKTLGAITAVPAGLLAVGGGVLDNIAPAKSLIEPVKDLLGDVPPWAWAGVVAAVAAGIWWNARKGEAASVEAVQTGARR